MEPVPAGRQAAGTATTCSASNASSWAEAAVAAGDHQVRMEFDYDGGGLGKGGSVTLYVDGTGRRGRDRASVPMVFSADETRRRQGHRIARQPRVPGRGNDFAGTIHWVQIDVDERGPGPDHYLTLEERLRIAMARQ